MRKVLTLLLALLVPSFCHGAATMIGGSGLFKLHSARSSPRGVFTVILNGEYTQDDYPRRDWGLTEADTLDMADKHHYFESRFGLSYGIFDFLESYIRLDMLAKYDEQSDQVRERTDTYSGGLSNLELGFKTCARIFESEESGIAIIPGARAYVNFGLFGAPSEDDELGRLGFIPSVGHSPDMGIDLLADLEVKPLAVHGSIGYLGVGKAKDEAYSRNNEIHWGVGAEIQAGPYVGIVGELLGEKLIDKPEWAADTLWMCPGLRFFTPVGVVFDFGAEFALTDFDFVPDDKSDGTSWNVIFGLSVTSQLIKKKPEPPQLEVAGKVTDKETGDPLGVVITFSGDTIKPIFSDPETGLYKVYLKEGGVRIRAFKKGYRWKDRVVPPDSKGRVVIDFELSKKVSAEGVLTGVIRDSGTHAPIGADVTMIDVAVCATTSELQTGIYKLTLLAGTHSVRVSAQNHRETVLPVVVESGKTVIQNFSLKAERVMKKGKRVILTGIVFASGSATIASSSYPVLQTALETLKGNPTVKVEVGGHTDSVGSASSNMRLSLARANAVRTWLVSRGILPERLTARGYGENAPIASNKTKHGRSQNRRIEFVVLSK
ncbi:hypothetical protein E3J38_07355 [candidate division TA06 bacterium]|uniref:OmpA-like domain-containing protein n=1 Tax=candidate division TA06 bacterium TaxID=2250710 RepID=A0A523XK26_UNCT6|nr:MAG: hypothetical protein E3J38_07355 [candidate division TA06 bacterium]